MIEESIVMSKTSLQTEYRFKSKQLNELQAKCWQHWLTKNSELNAQLSREHQQLLAQSFALSDFIFDSCMKQPELVVHLFTPSIYSAQRTESYQAELKERLSTCNNEADLFRILRQYRRQEMVLIAFRDMCLNIDINQSLLHLSSLADALILSAQHWLVEFYRPQWGVACDVDGNEIPLLIFAMGKLGGRELNFSSDIDLIFTYPQSGETQGGRRSLDNHQYFIRIGQKLIAALHQVTVDGFVYRVDMRLRPFGDSGPLVLSFSALEDYYQEQGRDWERYAMLKARLLGNSQYNQELYNMLKPFIYRRYIDFSVIESLRKMKQMIAQEVRRKQLTNNIKLGAGGIREIEFIVQVFQLIRGGREVALQQRHLLTVLPLLVEHGILSNDSGDKLRQSYLFLRRVENIVQAFADQQTQQLPETEMDQLRLIEILSMNSWSAFLDQCQQAMLTVHREFAHVIGEDKPHHEIDGEQWATFWQVDLSSDEALELVTQHQPQWPAENMVNLIASYREDVNKRPLGSRGRAVLDKLIPLLLAQLEELKCADVALKRVLHVLDRISTRTAYLELLYENQGALKQLVKLCSKSAWVAQHIAKYPILLDELIDPTLLRNTPQLSEYKPALHEFMLRVPEDDLEQQMEMLRQFKQARQLQIAAADISNIMPVNKVSDHLTFLAEAVVDQVVHIAWHHMVARYGAPTATLTRDEKDFAVIGYGKCGGIELSYSSDLDLVFVHCATENDVTNGAKPVSAAQFYLKLAQRIMHMFNTRTASGILYELDLRLRPSGQSGLTVVHINTYEQYQKQDAWTWEHQALVRARTIFGQPNLNESFHRIRQEILSQQRDKQRLAKDVAEMREKMRGHLDKSTHDSFDIKQCVGGLADIEFLVQYLVLLESCNKPQLTEFPDNIRVLQRCADVGLLSEQDSERLISIYLMLRNKGHHLALQNASNLISTEQYQQERTFVSTVWQRFFNEVI